jgi:hypothetical protein
MSGSFGESSSQPVQLPGSRAAIKHPARDRRGAHCDDLPRARGRCGNNAIDWLASRWDHAALHDKPVACYVHDADASNPASSARLRFG